VVELDLNFTPSSSCSCSQVLCAPGNAGIAAANDADCLPDLKISDGAAVVRFCQEHGIGLVVVGPEAPLVAGLVDDLTSEGIPAFGPTSAAAALEGSKAFMKVGAQLLVKRYWYWSACCASKCSFLLHGP
jgi:phosphoribosylamine--glycine ligase